MKNLLVVLLMLLVTIGYSQKKIEVTEGEYTFSTGEKHAYETTIYNVSVDDAIKAWKKEMKSKKAKVSVDNGEILADNAKIKTFPDNNPVDIYTVFEEAEDGAIKMYSAVNLGGVFLGPDHPVKEKAYKEMVAQFALNLTLQELKKELFQEENKLRSLESKRKKLISKKESLEKKIEKYENKIKEAEEDIEKNLEEQEKTSEEIKEQEERVKEAKAKLDEYK